MIIKLQPIFFDKVWGGRKIKNNYNYDCSDKTGEAWGISAHKNGSSIISNTLYKGMTLKELFDSNKELFGHHPSNEFPILIKIIDANDDLSIQVHPDDAYAKEHENSLGKTESWYILDAEPETKIIIGHYAKSFEELEQHVKNNDYESILNKFSISKGDQFNIYSGTIHAICKGTLLLEIQQSSDVTYRVYDYNRLSNGALRELHVLQALEVIKIPDNSLNKKKPTNLFDYKIQSNRQTTTHTSNQYGDYIFIMDGFGLFDDEPVKKGQFLFIPSNTNYKVTGDLQYFLGEIK